MKNGGRPPGIAHGPPDIAAGGKCGTRSGDEQAFYTVIGCALDEDFGKFPGGGDVQGIVSFGTVQRDLPDAISMVESYVRIHFDFSPTNKGLTDKRKLMI